MTTARYAAFGSAYITAYVSLVRRGMLEKDEWLLVHGAAGGVGLAAVDLGKQLGAKVIATASKDEKLAAIDTAFAPDALININDGFRDKVKELTGGGADVIYDPGRRRCIRRERALHRLGRTTARGRFCQWSYPRNFCQYATY